MYKIKNTIIFMLIVFMILIFTACKDENTSNENTDDNELDEEMIELEEKELSFYFSTYNSNGNKEILAPILEELEKKAGHLSIRLDFNWIAYDSYIEEIEKLLAANNNIDAFSYDSLNDLKGFNTELIMDITDKFNAYAPEYYNSLNAKTLEAITCEDKIIAIPNCNSNNLKQRCCVIARTDLVEKSGVNDITTHEEYGEFLKWVKENEAGIIPSKFNLSQSIINAYIYCNGYYQGPEPYIYYTYLKWEDKAPKIYTIDQIEQFKTLYKMLKEWKTSELFFSSTPNVNDWCKGLIASTMVCIDQLPCYAYAVESDYEYGFYPLYLYSKIKDNNIPSYYTMINANSKDADRILMFFEWLFSDIEAYNLLIYGTVNEYIEKNDIDIYKSRIGWDECI